MIYVKSKYVLMFADSSFAQENAGENDPIYSVIPGDEYVNQNHIDAQNSQPVTVL